MVNRIEARESSGRPNGEIRAEIRYRLPKELYESLSENERVLLRGLEEVVDAIEPIWRLQKQTPFFSRGLQEAEIRELGKKNPDIFSPYTYVERRNDEFDAVPYREKFVEQIPEIVMRLCVAKGRIPLGDYRLLDQFYERLESLAGSFENDSWEDADRVRFAKGWVNKVEYVIGPFETTFEHFGIKKTFQGVVGVIDEQKTNELNKLINAAKDRVLGKEIPDIDLKVMFVTAATGIKNPSTGEAWKAQVLPNEPEVAKEIGARGLVYMNLLEDHFETRLYPIMRKVFELGLFQKYTKQQLLTAYLNWIALHEVYHPITREVDQDKRQGSMFSPFHELHCDIAGLSAAWRLAEDNFLRDDQYEAILMVHVARTLNDIYSYYFSDKRFPDPYAEGSTAEFNYLVKYAGLKPQGEDGRLGLYQKDQVTAASINLYGRFNIAAKEANVEEVRELFKRYESGQEYKFAEPLLRYLFEEPQPVLGS